MSPIIKNIDISKTKTNYLLKNELEGNGIPFVVSLVFSNGSIRRRVCSSEVDIGKYLIELGIKEPMWSDSDLLIKYFERILSSKAIVLNEQGSATVDIVIEQIIPNTKIIIFGAGHVGKAVSEISAQMGWEIVIIDDRVEFLHRVQKYEARINTVNEPFKGALKKVGVSKTSALVIVTRGHQFDEICLEEGLETGAFYIGMIGSGRRVASILRRLEEKGISRERIARVHAPIGMEINARTPHEIAIAIIAEIIKVKNSAK